jgi:hypothetical protein
LSGGSYKKTKGRVAVWLPCPWLVDTQNGDGLEVQAHTELNLTRCETADASHLAEQRV